MNLRPAVFSALALLLLSLSACDRSKEGKQGDYHRLGNGMEVILVENHSNPMVSSVVSVNAGSAYEDGTNNGVSHLLEHLLFDGTGERTRTEIMDGVENHGGYLNATTRDDHTAFILLIPSEYAEVGLTIQADMLFNSMFPDSEIAKERKVVIEEINKDSDSESYAMEKFHRSHLYQGTPFSRPVIGFRNVIATISKDDIVGYYRERYVPENMTAFITGDFRSEEMLAILERIFGVVSPGNGPDVIDKVNMPRRSNKTFRLDSQADVSSVNISFDGPNVNDPDYYPFDFFTRLLDYHEGAPLSAILKGGDEPLAFSFSADLSPHRAFTTYTITARTQPGGEEAVIEAVIDLLKKESSRPPEKYDMKGVMVDLKSEEYFLKERYHYYGLMKAPYIVSGGFEFVDSYVDRMEEVTPSMVQGVAEKHFSRPRYVATITGPTPGIAKKAGHPLRQDEKVVKKVFDNGLNAIVREEKGSEVFAVHLLAGNRAYLETGGKTGLADFLSRMLLKGTLTRNREELATDLAGIGAKVTVVENPYIPYDDYYASRKYSFVRFEALGEYWRDGLEMLVDMVRNPSFDPGEIDNTRREMGALINQRDTSPYKAARRLYYKTLFANHPFSRSIMGSVEDVESISGADLKWLHNILYAPNNLTISIVSGVNADTVLAAVASLFSDQEPVEFPDGIPDPPGPVSSLKRVEEKLGKEQAYIYMGNLLPGIEDRDVPAIRMMIAILSERLALELREKEGLAYSIGASSDFARGFGWYAITMGTEQDNYRHALAGIRREIDWIRSETVSEELLSKTVNRFTGRSLMRRLSSINRAYFMGVYEFLLDDYREDVLSLDRLREVRPADVHRVARRYLRSDRGVLVSVR